MSEKRVIVLVIVYKRDVSDLEAVSLRQCVSIFRRHSVRLLCPEGLDISTHRSIVGDIEVDCIDPGWQRSLATYNKLMVDPFLYRKYRQYEYILVYQLDAFVFRDELDYWCSKDYDYIGAPWFADFSAARPDSPLLGVGNGGFSLRRTRSLLRALEEFEKTAGKAATGARDPFFVCAEYPPQEDIFWGIGIQRICKWFKVAPVEEAIRFSFEVQPRVLYAMNHHELPFGCHAWWRYDFAFWRRFIDGAGYTLPRTCLGANASGKDSPTDDVLA